MASTINAKTTGVGGIDASGDASGVLALQTGGTTAVTIDASQNVGIGTSSPNKQLQIQYGSSNSGQLQITNNSTGTTATDGVLFGYDTSNDVIINNQEATATKLYTSGSERMRIDSSGNLLVGTTSAQGIGTTISGSYMYQRSSATAGVFRCTGGDSANNYLVYNQSNIGMYLSNGGTSWLPNTSDARLKNKVSDIENALEAVQKLKALTFRYKKEDQNITPRYGFFAQNVGEAIPDAMIISPEKDENIDGDIYTYDAAIINVYLVKAIQELKAIIDTQNARIDALEAK